MLRTLSADWSTPNYDSSSRNHKALCAPHNRHPNPIPFRNVKEDLSNLLHWLVGAKTRTSCQLCGKTLPHMHKLKPLKLSISMEPRKCPSLALSWFATPWRIISSTSCAANCQEKEAQIYSIGVSAYIHTHTHAHTPTQTHIHTHVDTYTNACAYIKTYLHGHGSIPRVVAGPPPPLLQTLVAPALFQTLVARHCWGTSNITDRNVAE